MDKRLWGIAGASAVLFVPFVLLHADPYIEHAQSLCPHMLLTGLPCPGCGITKSLVCLYRGDLSASFGYHAFGPFVALGCMVAIAWLAAEHITGRRYLRGLVYNVRLAWAGAALLASYHVVRLADLLWHASLNDILVASIWR